MEVSALESEEIGEIVVELKEEGGSSAAEIGLILRDQYGVPDAKGALGQKLSAFLDERGLGSDLPEDLQNLIDRAANVRRHLSENGKDLSARGGLSELEARIRGLGRYYSREGVLPADWRYRAGRRGDDEGAAPGSAGERTSAVDEEL
ncbi:MAG: 30S ribosomal protein S15 [Methanonatronarchaeales archaeon]|nr:30S ribosomal protein S15 [Methanonatronarchaeales archaeon]